MEMSLTEIEADFTQRFNADCKNQEPGHWRL